MSYPETGATFGRHALNFADCVTCAPNRADHIGHPAIVDCFAKASDMHIDRPLVDVDGFAPNIVEQLAPRKDAARMLHHEFKQAEFRGAEPDLALFPINPVSLAVEHDVAHLEHTGKHLRFGA